MVSVRSFSTLQQKCFYSLEDDAVKVVRIVVYPSVINGGAYCVPSTGAIVFHPCAGVCVAGEKSSIASILHCTYVMCAGHTYLTPLYFVR
jgi:hypothetical protein